MPGPQHPSADTAASAVGPSAIAELARLVLAEGELDDLLGSIAVIARDAVPGADEVSMTLLRGEKAWTAGHSGQLALDADELQYERGVGPCMDAGRAGEVFVVDDMRIEQRWGDYPATVAVRGVLSSMSLPLPLQESVIGALNVYSREAGSFGPESIASGREIAAFVAVAVANARSHDDARNEAQHMSVAMTSRAVIEQAKGIVMAERHCSPEEAFDLLRDISQRQNVKLRDLAARLVQDTARPRG